MSPLTRYWFVGLSTLVVAGFALLGHGQEADPGTKYALVVGVTDYHGAGFTPLKYTVNDAEELATILTQHKTGGFQEKNVRVLTNKRGAKNKKDMPTASNIKAAIDELLTGKGKNDTVLIAFAGHGAIVRVQDPDEKGPDRYYPYFCPYDAELNQISYSSGRSKFLVNLKSDLFEKLEAKRCGAGSRLVLIDACRNELEATDARRDLQIESETVPKGVAVLFSCSAKQRAFETPKLGKGHGVFFHFVLEGLRGRAAAPSSDFVTWAGLVDYATQEVEKWVPEHIRDGAKQTPHTYGNTSGSIRLVPKPRSLPAPPPPPKGKDNPGKEPIDPKPTPKPVLLVEDKTSGFRMEFVLIPATGPKGFQMGSTAREQEEVLGLVKDKIGRARVQSEERRRKVLSSYYLGRFEVTQQQFQALMDYNPSCNSKDGTGRKNAKYPPKFGPAARAEFVRGHATNDFPVENVSYHEAQEFVQALNQLLRQNKLGGYTVRLPTEAEWEYACRGGDRTESFHLGKQASNSISSTKANFNGEFPFGGGEAGKHLQRPTHVGDYAPNAFGLYDMHGNVWEWCQEWYDPDKEMRVVKGGGFTSRGVFCRAATRDAYKPEERYTTLGFRVALIPPP